MRGAQAVGLHIWFFRVSPEPSVLGSSSSRNDFGDEDTGVFTDVGVVCAACDAEAQPRVSLETQTTGVFLGGESFSGLINEDEDKMWRYEGGI